MTTGRLNRTNYYLTAKLIVAKDQKTGLFYYGKPSEENVLIGESGSIESVDTAKMTPAPEGLKTVAAVAEWCLENGFRMKNYGPRGKNAAQVPASDPNRMPVPGKPDEHKRLQLVDLLAPKAPVRDPNLINYLDVALELARLGHTEAARVVVRMGQEAAL